MRSMQERKVIQPPNMYFSTTGHELWDSSAGGRDRITVACHLSSSSLVAHLLHCVGNVRTSFILNQLHNIWLNKSYVSTSCTHFFLRSAKPPSTFTAREAIRHWSGMNWLSLPPNLKDQTELQGMFQMFLKMHYSVNVSTLYQYASLYFQSRLNIREQYTH